MPTLTEHRVLAKQTHKRYHDVESSHVHCAPPGSSGSTTSTVYVHRGKVVGCSCHSRTYHPRQACKHMQAKQAELDLLSCLYCGRRTGGALMCAGCAW